MDKDEIIAVTVFLSSIFIAGFLIGSYLFPHPKYITETEVTKKCRELGGILKSGQDTDRFARDFRIIYSCNSPSTELFRY